MSENKEQDKEQDKEEEEEPRKQCQTVTCLKTSLPKIYCRTRRFRKERKC
ncbi:MAG: hypothetical protein IPI39_20365 [Candidatus Obscuribacter sp.]|nr:hypothetical protein [Candidatus Obscuribacter sp.]